jgi:hypothetical protein
MKKLLFIIVILVSLSSCLRVSYPRGGKGYGCRGKESWPQLMKRINKPY